MERAASERAEVLCKECLSLYRAAKETREAHEMAAALLEEGRTLASTNGDRRNLAYLLHFLGMAAISRQSYREARSLLEESQQYHRQMENRQDLVWSSLYLGQVCFGQERSVVRREARVSSICLRSLPRLANVSTTSS
jgi:hypothetical protein